MSSSNSWCNVRDSSLIMYPLIYITDLFHKSYPRYTQKYFLTFCKQPFSSQSQSSSLFASNSICKHKLQDQQNYINFHFSISVFFCQSKASNKNRREKKMRQRKGEGGGQMKYRNRQRQRQEKNYIEENIIFEGVKLIYYHTFIMLEIKILGMSQKK